MEVAFVGITRDYSKLDPEYIDFFNQYHLEIPFYYAKHAPMNVTIVTPNYSSDWKKFEFGGSLRCLSESDFYGDEYDVIVHWRKFFECYCLYGKINIMNCCDHSFSLEWLTQVREAIRSKCLDGIMTFPGWHTEQVSNELGLIKVSEEGPIFRAKAPLLSGYHLGVDTDIYRPSDNKNPFDLLWASDPGRGLHLAIELTRQLYAMDKRFKLHICYPDYVKQPSIPDLPFLVNHGNVKNGPELWSMFNRCGILPYTSTFKEPSSRAHRQAQASGCLVLYPPDMGSPSNLIIDGETGYVRPIGEWTNLIMRAAINGTWVSIGKKARDFAISENWQVQAKRFYELMEIATR